MKKILCYLLILFILITSCVGCGSSKKKTSSNEQDNIESEVEKNTDSNNKVSEETTDEKESEISIDSESEESSITASESTSKESTKNNNESSTTSHKHNYTETVVNPTCTAAGTRTYTCASCSHTYKETIPMINHTWTPATCDSPKVCSVCGTTEGSALGHSENAKGCCERCGKQLIVISEEEREIYMVAACAMNYFFKTSKFPQTVHFTNIYYTTDNGAGNKLWLVEGYGENNFGGNSYAYVNAMVFAEPTSYSASSLYNNYKLNDNLYARTVANNDNPYRYHMQMFTQNLNKKKLNYMYYQLFDEYVLQFD